MKQLEYCEWQTCGMEVAVCCASSLYFVIFHLQEGRRALLVLSFCGARVVSYIVLHPVWDREVIKCLLMEFHVSISKLKLVNLRFHEKMYKRIIWHVKTA